MSIFSPLEQFQLVSLIPIDILGFNITLVTTAKTKEESLALLRELTLPMQK